MKFNTGDKVLWMTPQGITYGHVVEKLESNKTYGVVEIHASHEEPAYIVKSDASGRLAAHTSDALCKD